MRFLGHNPVVPRPVATRAFPVDTTVAPTAGSIVFTGFAPRVTIEVATPLKRFRGNNPRRSVNPVLLRPVAARAFLANTVVSPGAGLVVFTGFAPVVRVGTTVAPGAGSVVFAGKTPAVSAGTTVAPGAGSIVFTGHAPTVTVGTTVSPGAGSVVFTGFAPSVDTGGGVVVAVVTGSGDDTPADVRRRKWLEWAAKRKKRQVPEPAVRQGEPSEQNVSRAPDVSREASTNVTTSAPAPILESPRIAALRRANLEAQAAQAERLEREARIRDQVAAMQAAIAKARDEDEDDVMILLWD